MARPLRIDVAGGWYHVTARGNERRNIFRDDRDRHHLLELLGALPTRFGLRIHAYVLMSNHYHLLLETTEVNLSAAMQWFSVSYSVWFNRRHGRVGHLFQGRFKAILVERDEWGAELSRYIHLNPVRVRRYGLDKGRQREKRAGVGAKAEAKLVAARIEELRGYRWSSYRAYAGWEKPPSWLETASVLALGGGRAGGARAARGYRRWVEEAVREGQEESPWERLEAGVVLGGSGFVGRMRKWLRGDKREQAGLKRLQGRPSWEKAVAVVEAIKGERWEEFRDRYGDWGRDMALYLGRTRCGMKLKALCEAAGGIDYGSAGNAVKRFGTRVGSDRKLAALLREAESKLMNDEM
ncbi:MAG: hypothetical protein EXS18_02320 [Verrucomicrobiae bacterium]|nr:hypothetical protein [Verrucomicrobiae bacterium]